MKEGTLFERIFYDHIHSILKEDENAYTKRNKKRSALKIKQNESYHNLRKKHSEQKSSLSKKHKLQLNELRNKHSEQLAAFDRRNNL